MPASDPHKSKRGQLALLKPLGLATPLGQAVHGLVRTPLGKFTPSVVQPFAQPLGQLVQTSLLENSALNWSIANPFSGTDSSFRPDISAEFVDRPFVAPSPHDENTSTADPLNELKPLGQSTSLASLASRTTLTQAVDFLSLSTVDEPESEHSRSTTMQLAERGITPIPRSIKSQVQAQIQTQLEPNFLPVSESTSQEQRSEHKQSGEAVQAPDWIEANTQGLLTIDSQPIDTQSISTQPINHQSTVNESIQLEPEPGKTIAQAETTPDLSPVSLPVSLDFEAPEPIEPSDTELQIQPESQLSTSLPPTETLQRLSESDKIDASVHYPLNLNNTNTQSQATSKLSQEQSQSGSPETPTALPGSSQIQSQFYPQLQPRSEPKVERELVKSIESVGSPFTATQRQETQPSQPDLTLPSTDISLQSISETQASTASIIQPQSEGSPELFEETLTTNLQPGESTEVDRTTSETADQLQTQTVSENQLEVESGIDQQLSIAPLSSLIQPVDIEADSANENILQSQPESTQIQLNPRENHVHTEQVDSTLVSQEWTLKQVSSEHPTPSIEIPSMSPAGSEAITQSSPSEQHQAIVQTKVEPEALESDQSVSNLLAADSSEILPTSNLTDLDTVQAHANIANLLQHQALGLSKPLATSHDLIKPTSSYLTSSQVDEGTDLNSTSVSPGSVQLSATTSDSINRTPETWSSIDELLKPSTSPISESWQQQFALQPLAEAVTSPASEDLTISGKLVSPIAPHAAQDFESEAITSGQYTLSNPIVTTTKPGVKVPVREEQLEFMAQLVYRLVRDRWAIDKERYFQIVANHPPWVNIISPEFFQAITMTLVSDAPNVQQQPFQSPPPRALEALTQEVYQLIQLRLEQDRER